MRMQPWRKLFRPDCVSTDALDTPPPLPRVAEPAVLTTGPHGLVSERMREVGAAPDDLTLPKPPSLRGPECPQTPARCLQGSGTTRGAEAATALLDPGRRPCKPALGPDRWWPPTSSLSPGACRVPGALPRVRTHPVTPLSG